VPILPAVAARPAMDQPHDGERPVAPIAAPPIASEPIARPLEPTSNPATQTSVTPPTHPFSWPEWLLAVYLAGVVVMLGRLALGFALYRRTIAASQFSNGADITDSPILADRIRRAWVVVGTCPTTRVPLAVGWLHPRILLPDGWQQWDPAKRDAALAHELAHVERRDTLLTLIGALNLCVYWFHPLAWLLRHRLASLAEHACDDLAIAWTGRRTQYARHLLEFAKTIAGDRDRLAATALSMADGGDLRSRIGAILDRDRPAARPLGWQHVAGIVIVAALIVPPIAAMQLQRRAAAAALSQSAAQDSRELHGIVLGPDGRPFTGARLYVPYENSRGYKFLEKGRSGPDGRFRFRLARPEFGDVSYDPLTRLHVAAWSDGLGVGWANIGGLDGQPIPDTDLTLRLVNDVPIEGRILTLEGKPVAGARIKVDFIQSFHDENITEGLQAIQAGTESRTTGDLWFGLLPRDTGPITTDGTGRFHIQGAGRERLLRLQLDGPGIQSKHLFVATRPPVRAGASVLATRPYGDEIYAARFEHLARPSRPIRGVVREKATGRPVAGAMVGAPSYTMARVKSDVQGRYELPGYPKGSEYELSLNPAEGQPFFSAQHKVSDTAGLEPIEVDFDLVRGIVVRGRLTDGETGKPTKGEVHYFPLDTNPRAEAIGSPRYFDAASRTVSDEQGNYSVVVLPGPGMLAITGWGGRWTRHLVARIDRDELKRIAPNASASNLDVFAPVATGGPLLLSNYNEIRLIRPADGEGGPIRQDIALRVGRTVTGRVVGPGGKPIAGASVFGATSHAFDKVATNRAGEFTITALDPDGKRVFNISDAAGKLGLYTQIRGDQAGPVTFRLQPSGSAAGRIVDEAGQPYRNRPLVFHRAGYVGAGDLTTRTDDSGAFLMEGLVPGQPYQPASPKDPSPNYKAFTVSAGEKKDLGEARLKP
jgi:beta-lactamase regulating signal transducer with metallopeptidase domain